MDNLFDGVEMIILKDISFELVERLITKRTTMMSIDSLLYAFPTIYMSTSSDIAIFNGIQTHCTLKLRLELACVYFEGVAGVWINVVIY